MPDREVFLSRKENDAIQAYADSEGITPEEAIKKLATENLANRLRSHKNNKGEIRTFRLPKRD